MSTQNLAGETETKGDFLFPLGVCFWQTGCWRQHAPLQEHFQWLFLSSLGLETSVEAGAVASVGSWFQLPGVRSLLCSVLNSSSGRIGVPGRGVLWYSGSKFWRPSLESTILQTPYSLYWITSCLKYSECFGFLYWGDWQVYQIIKYTLKQIKVSKK